MLRKVIVLSGAVIGAAIGYLRTEDFVQDTSGLVWGIVLGSVVGYVVYDVVGGLLED